MDSKIKAPFGKKNKSPAENADCFLKSLLKFMEMKGEGKNSKKSNHF